MVLENQENMDLGVMQGLRLRPTQNKRKRERVAELMVPFEWTYGACVPTWLLDILQVRDLFP